MNKLVVHLLLLLLPAIAFTQSIDYNEIIPPANALNISFEEKLVRLAWQNNPENKIIDYQTKIAQLEVKQARWSWLDNFRAQGNLNEFVLDESADVGGRAAFFPKYNLSAQISLGYFVNIPLEVKRNKQEVYISKLTSDQQKLSLRAEVLTRYKNYLINRELLFIQTEITEDLYASFTLAKQKFRNGEITLAAYNAEQDRFNNQRMRQVTVQGNVDIAKIAIEELIGVKLEEVQ